MLGFSWHGDAIRKRIEAEMGRRLDASAIVVTNHVRKMISIEGAGKSAPGRGVGGRYTKGRLIYGLHSSKPGEPPRKQTGRLAASIAWEREGFIARIGTNVRYARPLEEGTSRMAARPFLLRALREKTPQVQAILRKPIGP